MLYASGDLDDKPKITGFDHLSLTVKDLNATIHFYSGVLNFTLTTFANGRVALRFGSHKIKLHIEGLEITPQTKNPTCGSGDFCLLTSTTIPKWIEHLNAHQVPIVAGPVERSGAVGPITSIYIQDPDGNMIEIAKYN